MLKRYSKPVLTNEENSCYIEEKKFNLIVTNMSSTKEKVLITLNLECNSDIINNYLKKSIAKFGLKITTNFNSFFMEYEYSNSEYVVELETSKLERVDKIKMIAYVLANQNIQYEWNEELKDYYDNSYIFNYSVNEILAESNEEVVTYKESGSSFIHICRSSEQSNKGLLFSINKENMIQVKVGDEYNEAFNKLQSEEKKVCVKDILNSFLAFNSILYSINKMVFSEKNISDYSENIWFKALDNNFDDPKYDDFITFVEAMQSNPDVDEIMRVTQTLLGNQLELKTIDTWRKVK